MNFWEERYQLAQTGWERGGINPAFDIWQGFKDLTPGSVLIPGCGRAPEVRAFADQGWHVVAVDMAPSAVAFQRENNHVYADRVSVVEADLLAWQPHQTFDLIYEQTCLCALNPQFWSQYEQRLAEWVAPGGQLAALFMQTNKQSGPPYHCDWHTMRALFSPSRWHWPDSDPITSTHPSGIHELGVRLIKL
jgi:methyl halide transferase